MPQPPDAARGSDAKITRELVLAAALDIIDRDGTDALSCRRRLRPPGTQTAFSAPAAALAPGSATGTIASTLRKIILEILC